MHAQATRTARSHRDLRGFVELIEGLRLAPEIAQSATTPALRRLIARSRIARLRPLLGAPSPSAQLPLPMQAAFSADARKATLLEATLLPLVSTDPTQHPELHERLRLAIRLAKTDLCVRGGWRRLEQLAATTPASLRSVWTAVLWDVLTIEANAWRDQAAELLPEQALDGLNHAQRHHVWSQAHAQKHPAAPRLWMWMTLLATLDDRCARNQPARSAILFA